MFVRHFHATLLVIISIIILFILTLALGHKPELPAITQQDSPTVTPQPTPQPQQTFLYYDYTPGYNSFYTIDTTTGNKTGIYGGTATQPYTTFSMYNNQLQLQGKTTAGILQLWSHFFYPISQTQIPETTSPDENQEVFVNTILNPKTRIPTLQFTILNANKQETLIPASQSASLTFQPLCWVNNNTEIILRYTNFLYTLNEENMTFTQLPSTPEQLQATNIYCNGQTNTFYFQTKQGIYQQKFQSSTITQVPLKPQTALNINSLIFPYHSNNQQALTSLGPNLMQLNLLNGQQQTLYTATQSATILPYLWENNTIVFTQEGENKDGSYFIVGKTLNTQNQIISIFANHKNKILEAAGEIIPLNWFYPNKYQ